MECRGHNLEREARTPHAGFTIVEHHHRFCNSYSDEIATGAQ